MLDRSIPFYNVIMKKNGPGRLSAAIPEGYALFPYAPGDESAWARMECAIGDFSSEEEAVSYFRESYLNGPIDIQKRMTVCRDRKGETVGACIAWRDPKGDGTVPSLHWLVTDPIHQGKGIGSALILKTLEIFDSFGETEVYIHTQPWSHTAICLYERAGFRMQKTDTFSRYQNQYALAMEVLSKILPKEKYQRILESAEE